MVEGMSLLPYESSSRCCGEAHQEPAIQRRENRSHFCGSCWLASGGDDRERTSLYSSHSFVTDIQRSPTPQRRLTRASEALYGTL